MNSNCGQLTQSMDRCRNMRNDLMLDGNRRTSRLRTNPRFPQGGQGNQFTSSENSMLIYDSTTNTYQRWITDSTGNPIQPVGNPIRPNPSPNPNPNQPPPPVIIGNPPPVGQPVPILNLPVPPSVNPINPVLTPSNIPTILGVQGTFALPYTLGVGINLSPSPSEGFSGGSYNFGSLNLGNISASGGGF